MATKEKMKQEEKYTSSDIQVLEGLEAVRLRPGMYIGTTGQAGLHHLIYELVDNGVDEYMAGEATAIYVHIKADGSVMVEDDGRGIPVDKHKSTGLSGVETVMTTLHAGGKFGGKAYSVSGGLHGVGASIVNALSNNLGVKVYRNGKCYSQEFAKGQATTPLNSEPLTPDQIDRHGTIVEFFPDDTIFESVAYDYEILTKRFKEMAYVNKGLAIRFRCDWSPVEAAEETTSENSERDVTFKFDGGIKEFVTNLNANRTVLHDEPLYMEKQVDGTMVEVAIQYHDAFTESSYAFANCINTEDGGTHLTGFKSAITRVVNDYAKKQGLLKEGNLAGEDTREGLTSIISVKLPDPQFEGQTKTKLGNPEVRNQVETVVAEHVQIFLEDHPQDSKRIIEKCLTSQRAREAARKARDLIIRKNAMDGGSLPGKLADCSDKNPENCELYLVEGDSAGGTAKMGRDRGFQAILPLRGKILNVEKAREDKMLSNEAIQSITIAIGGGLGEDFNLEKLRYHRIIIMTDADVDGSHIRTLLLTFFYRNMQPLITSGHLYMAMPPLYNVTQGKKQHWAYSEDELDKTLSGLTGKSSPHIQRYKGLGEMNAEQLWETTMNPEDRTLLQVNQGDGAAADEMFSLLMGDVVEPRRNFIQTHALDVKNLDV